MVPCGGGGAARPVLAQQLSAEAVWEADRLMRAASTLGSTRIAVPADSEISSRFALYSLMSCPAARGVRDIERARAECVARSTGGSRRLSRRLSIDPVDERRVSARRRRAFTSASPELEPRRVGASEAAVEEGRVGAACACGAVRGLLALAAPRMAMHAYRSNESGERSVPKRRECAADIEIGGTGGVGGGLTARVRSRCARAASHARTRASAHASRERARRHRSGPARVTMMRMSRPERVTSSARLCAAISVLMSISVWHPERQRARARVRRRQAAAKLPPSSSSSSSDEESQLSLELQSDHEESDVSSDEYSASPGARGGGGVTTIGMPGSECRRRRGEDAAALLPAVPGSAGASVGAQREELWAGSE
mmetsp:Transcript_4123/g.10666  ORF Transcript_4123/g.10666 Transcript_4123/m.10666 type:complete len:370 (-) Transcript_4123:696-1805(-)